MRPTVLTSSLLSCLLLASAAVHATIERPAAAGERYIADLLSASPTRRDTAALVLATQDVLSAGELQALVDTAASEAGARGDRELGSLAASLQCRRLYRLGDLRGAREACRAAERALTEESGAMVRFLAMLRSAQIQADMGDLVGGLGRYQSALRIAEAMDSDYAVAAVLNLIGIAAANAGAYAESADSYARALLRAQEAGDAGLQTMILTNLGGLELRGLNFEGARLRYEQAIELASKAGLEHTVFFLQVGRADALRGLGRYAEADAILGRLLASAASGIDSRYLSDAYEAAARVALARDDAPRAERLARAAMQNARALAFRRSEAQLVLARALSAQGRRDAALAVLAQVEAGARAFPRLRFEAIEQQAALATRELELSRARLDETERRSELDRARLMRAVLALLAVVLALVLVWIGWAQRQQRRVAAELRARLGDRTREVQSQMERQRILEHEVQGNRRLEALGRLTGGIAHDFNNLLTIVQQCNDLLRIDPAIRGNPRLKALLDESASAAAAGAGISRQLVAFARQQPLAMRVQGFGEILLRNEPILRRAAGESHRLQIDCRGGDVRLMIDESQFITALINVIANAAEASEPGASIVLRSRIVQVPGEVPDQGILAPGPYLEVAVVDRGSGMDADVLERAREPFFTTRQQRGGSGLGLSMVHGFAVQSGGVLRLESLLGVGTTAALLLPVLEQTVASESTES